MRACLSMAILTAATVASACTAPIAAPALESATFHTPIAPSPAAGTMFFFPERIPLEGGGFVNAERGMYFAPVNRSVPDSAVIGVEVYRFRASPNAEPGTPPIFFLHGGPSFAGLEWALEQAGTFEQRWLPLTNVSDVVVVGQRGIGSSKPTTTIDVTTPSTRSDQPSDAGEAAAQFQRVLAAERSFWEESRLDLRGFTVLEAAEDVNEVRQALGYDKIIVWGGSFGSHWGMSLMRLHPEIVERAILRGMEGPDHTYDHPGHLWNVYRRVAEEAEAAAELQGMIPDGGLIAAIEAVVARAAQQPFTVPVADPADGSRHEVLFDSESIKSVSRGYSGGLAAWPADVITMSRGDFSEAALRLYEQSSSAERDFTTASYFMLDCGSGITPQRLADQDAEPGHSPAVAHELELSRRLSGLGQRPRRLVPAELRDRHPDRHRARNLGYLDALRERPRAGSLLQEQHVHPHHSGPARCDPGGDGRFPRISRRDPAFRGDRRRFAVARRGHHAAG